MGVTPGCPVMPSCAFQFPVLYRHRVKCLRNGVMGLTRHQQNKQKKSWSRLGLTNTVKGSWNYQEMDTYTMAVLSYRKKKKKEGRKRSPEGCSTCLGPEEPAQALIPALPGWGKPCSKRDDDLCWAAVLGCGRLQEQGGSSEKVPAAAFWKCPLGALVNEM